MTTTVIVKAHCDREEVEVKIITTEKNVIIDEQVIQDGEEFETVVFDDREIVAKEVKK